jgi:hypothetical protein
MRCGAGLRFDTIEVLFKDLRVFFTKKPGRGRLPFGPPCQDKSLW